MKTLSIEKLVDRKIVGCDDKVYKVEKTAEGAYWFSCVNVKSNFKNNNFETVKVVFSDGQSSIWEMLK
jgi:hypothetical protein